MKDKSVKNITYTPANEAIFKTSYEAVNGVIYWATFRATYDSTHDSTHDSTYESTYEAPYRATSLRKSTDER